MPKVRIYRSNEPKSNPIPQAIPGDAAGQHDIRHPLHHMPLKKRFGPNYTSDQTTTTGPSEVSKEIVPSLYLRNGDMNVSGEEDGNY